MRLVRALGWLVAAFVGLFIFLMIVSMVSPQSPADRDKADRRRIIAQCWEEQGRKSLAPGTARFVAATCEGMEDEFRKVYGYKP